MTELIRTIYDCWLLPGLFIKNDFIHVPAEKTNPI